MMKKGVISLLVFVLFFISATNTTFANGNSDQERFSNETIDTTLTEIIDIISEEIVIEQTGIKLENRKVVIKELNKLDFELLNEIATSQGIEYNGKLNSQRLLNMYLKGIKDLNKEIKNKDVLVLENGTLVDADDDGFYVQGGATYDVKRWWGVKRYKSNSSARRWEFDIRAAGQANAAGAIVGGLVFGPWGVAANGITSVYLFNIADRISYHNGRTSRGIIANMHYTLTFSITTQ